jgi:hypothetical protein
MDFRNRIVGLVRFSYPALTGFVHHEADPASQVAFLYDPLRLEARFQFFEALTLPSLKAQTDPDFATVILTGKDLPDWAVKRLCKAMRDLPQSHLVQLPPMLHYSATQAAFATVPMTGFSHLTSFRLDDDDALDISHVTRLRQMAESLARTINPQRPFCIGHNRGLFVDLTRPEPRWSDVTEKYPLGVGLAMCAPVERRENIFRRNHRLLHMFFTTLTEAETPAYIRTVHAGNDSAAQPSGHAREVPRPKLARLMRHHFPFLSNDLLTKGSEL